MRKMIRVANPEPFVEREDDDMIICRCEEITKGEIRRAVYDGMRTTNEVKRYLRSGMGLCQGQTCQRLVQGIIAFINLCQVICFQISIDSLRHAPN